MLQQIFLEASAAPNMDTARTVTASGVSSDIYGIKIPDDVCEDAMVDFSTNVNGFMEAKFEVVLMVLCSIVTFSLLSCHRGKMAAQVGLRTPPQRIQGS